MALKRWIKQQERPGSSSTVQAGSSPSPAESRPCVNPPPASGSEIPILPGWLVAYRGPDGKLRGGWEERDHGTIRKGRFSDGGWIFTLTDGTEISVRAIVSVAQVALDGRVVAAWTVREHGLDGNRDALP